MKKGLVYLVVILGIGLCWYLFLKPQDYRITVNVKAIPGTINQSLKLWSDNLPEESTIDQKESLYHLKQQIQVSDSVFNYDWHIDALTDSTSKITVDVTDLEHSIMNRIKIAFKDTPFEKGARQRVMDFVEKLTEHQKSIKITIIGQEALQSTYCGCVALQGKQFHKASEMMKSYPLLNAVFVQNNITLNGLPFIEVKHWDMDNDEITYDFCYPIIEPESLPFINGITFKTFHGGPALKAIYNGNYITSDRAWYALLQYAEKNHIPVKKTPIEFFFNNPNLGGEALNWKTEVFLPLEK